LSLDVISSRKRLQRYNKYFKYANFFAIFLKKMAFFLHLSIFICNFVGFLRVRQRKRTRLRPAQ